VAVISAAKAGGIESLNPAPNLISYKPGAGPVRSFHQIALEDARLLQVSGVHGVT
jgi:hypothetical protein